MVKLKDYMNKYLKQNPEIKETIEFYKITEKIYLECMQYLKNNAMVVLTSEDTGNVKFDN